MQHSGIHEELTTFRDKLEVPAVIGAVTNADELIAVEAIGTRSRTDSTPVTIDDQWHLGSCTKSITALAYARLVEARVARWEVPVTELFDDISVVDDGWGKVTIDDLLRCRAGVPPNPSRKQMLASHKSTASAPDQRSEATERVLSSSPQKPGSFNYSNLGYAVVGAAIDRLTGTSYEDAVFKEVFTPLGITSAGFGPPPLIRGHLSRVSVGPLLAGKGNPVELSGKEPADNPVLLTPAGRIHLSVPDWATLQRVFLNDGEPLVSAETIEHMLFDPGAGSKARSMSMGWASGAALVVTHAMQGSNTMWAATALMDLKSRRTALTVVNDGRMTVITGSAHLTSNLLRATK